MPAGPSAKEYVTKSSHSNLKSLWMWTEFSYKDIIKNQFIHTNFNAVSHNSQSSTLNLIYCLVALQYIIMSQLHCVTM